MTDPVRRALAAAAHEASRSGYAVPEGAVRARARRRRAVRVGATGLLSLALLGGSGMALLSVDWVRDEPLGPAESGISGPAICSWDGSSSTLYTLLPLSSDTLRVEAAPGAPISLEVTLRNNSGAKVEVDPEGGPVLVVTASDDDPTVVGFALPVGAVGADVPPGASTSHSGFGPIVACPGAPTDGTTLAPGTYPFLVGQRVGSDLTVEADLFTTWSHLGELEVVQAGSTPSSGAPLPTGTCGARTGTLWATTALHLTTSPADLIVAPGSSLEVEIQLVNQTRSRVVSPAAGGPVLFVTGPDKRIVAILEPFDDVPSDDLGPGGRFTFSDLPALTDCATGEPLPEGTYEYQLARRQPQGERPFDLWTPPRVLLVTSQEVERHLVTWPSMPVCGEEVDELALDPGAVPTRFTHFDVIELEGPGETGGGGAGPDHAVIETFVKLDEPITFDNGIRAVRWHHVLLREGRVVAAMEWELGEGDELDGEPGGLESTPVTLVFTDCQTGEPHILDGEYVTFGYLGYEIEHPPGIRELWTVALGPHTFEHHP